MAGATTDRIVTGEEFLKLVEAAPEDVTLELIRGHVREIPTTTRGPRHAMAIARFSHKLISWLDEQESRAGVRQVWVADPDFRSVIVHRPDAEQQLFTAQHEFDAEPELPGFRPLVASLFEGQRTSN